MTDTPHAVGERAQRPLFRRLRRLRASAQLRNLVRETHWDSASLIMPMFVSEAIQDPVAIPSMPGIFQWPVSQVADEARRTAALGIGGVLLFGIPHTKDSAGSRNDASDGPVQRAIESIKASSPELVVVTDVCMCEYTDHGHCGVLNVGGPDRPRPELPEGYLLNDLSLEFLDLVACSHAAAGADVIAPSGMLDGAVGSIRSALDSAGYDTTPIMSYATKYASALFAPFRDAADSLPSFGDRHSHQLDPANRREAALEAALDVEEGADMLMVKPALAYLDIVSDLRRKFDIPIAVYNVSGEYAMVKAAAERGWIDERRTVIEMLTGMHRAGADIIVTYHANDAAGWLRDQRETMA